MTDADTAPSSDAGSSQGRDESERAVAPERRAATAAREHQRRHDDFARRTAAEEALGLRISFARLVLFIAAVSLIGVGISRGGSTTYLAIGVATFVAFLLAVIAHAVVIARRDRYSTRQAIHEKHLRRIAGRTQGFPNGAVLVPPDHAYAADLDLVGPGSIFERISVTHTGRGAETLARWLCAPADRETIEARQRAVVELAADLEARQELEASVLDTGVEGIDPRPFLELAQSKPFVMARRWLQVVIIALPIATLVTFLLSGGILPRGSWLLPLAIQGLLVWRLDRVVGERYALLSARRRLVESFAAMLRIVERAKWRAPLLVALQQRLRVDGQTPSVQLSRLETWSSLFDLRTQPLVHIVIDAALFWDLHCLWGVERWMARAGKKCGEWFEVLGEVEALASLATLYDQDPGAALPELAEEGAPLIAEGIVHPLIAPGRRVKNDVTIAGPGSVVVVTGSNMAGKSTLLRAIGVNVALALAGGPVCASRLSLPLVRLRASMRVSDSVQSGASYFQAELQRLRTVIGDADRAPPVLFLLDELLRGTNARARHKGARAVVRHLLARRAMGWVATHDIALSELEREMPGQVANVHFTDVFENGEMTFDYRLRPGVVKTSNALRLLKAAGIEVEADDTVVSSEISV